MKKILDGGKQIHIDSCSGASEKGKRVYQFHTEGVIYGSFKDMLSIAEFIRKYVKSQGDKIDS